MSGHRPPRSGRGRRPTEQVRAEVLTAAGRLLMEEGMRSFTIERVAAEAGASKMTIYKLWPSRGVLALEGYATVVADHLDMPDSGDIEADLTAHLRSYVQLLRDTPAGRVYAEPLGAAQTDPQLATALQHKYSDPRRALGLLALHTAQERGDIRADADLEVLIDQLWGSCLYRLITPGLCLGDDFARTVVRHVFNGVRSRAAGRSLPREAPS